MNVALCDHLYSRKKAARPNAFDSGRTSQFSIVLACSPVPVRIAPKGLRPGKLTIVRRGLPKSFPTRPATRSTPQSYIKDGAVQPVSADTFAVAAGERGSPNWPWPAPAFLSRYAYGWFMMSEDLPDPDSRVMVQAQACCRGGAVFRVRSALLRWSRFARHRAARATNMLEEAIGGANARIWLSEAIEGQGAAIVAQACKLGLKVSSPTTSVLLIARDGRVTG
ncbi:hypothetical protein LPJGGPFB_04849 [Ensifer adhaerens]|nr:hypothetical protein [Ensifer adhaerens]